MMIIENPNARSVPPQAHVISPDDLGKTAASATGPYRVPFEILGEPIVPGLTQVPLVLQGTFIQITNTGTVNGSIVLRYQPTAPFVVAPPGGKIALAANYIFSDLKIYDLTPNFQRAPTGPQIGFTIPANGTIIVGVQYVATGLALAAQSVAATESAGNRGFVELGPYPGTTFLATATIRQFFVSQQGSPLVPIAAAAYSVPIGGGPVIAG